MSQWQRLRETHSKLGGGRGIFGEAAREHDERTEQAGKIVFEGLKKAYPHLEFQLRTKLLKSEINGRLHEIDARLGTVQFDEDSGVSPDGGILEVKDVHGDWRILLIGEAKKQGTNVQRIQEGLKKQSIGNAIERVHKNIAEFKNLMLREAYFPYVVYMHGSDFTTEVLQVKDPDGNIVELGPTSIPDRVTAANYGLAVNRPYCRNLVVTRKDGRKLVLQIASLYLRNDPWTLEEMVEANTAISEMALEVLGESKQLPAPG